MAYLEPIDLSSILSPEPAGSVVRAGRTALSVLGPCTVCLKKATGYHYEVVSCDGCKSFFRRVITEKLNYKCSSQGSCYKHLVPGGSAPRCRSCRFKKCVEVGMNRFVIQSELQKFKEKHSDHKLVIGAPLKSVDSQISQLIERLVYLDMKAVCFRDCSYSPVFFPTLREAVKNEISILSIADRMGPMPGWPIPQVTAEKFSKFRKYIPAFETNILPENMKRWLPYSILTLIEMTKTFDFFRKLSERDRYFLFRDTLLMVFNLTRSYISVAKGFDRFVNPDGTTPAVKSPSWLPAEIHHKFFVVIGARAIGGLISKKMTKTEYLLIQTILLCNAAAPEISKEARETLFVERKKYTMALLKHTMAGHGSAGPGRLGELLNIIDVLERQQKDQRDVYLLISFYGDKSFKVPLFDEVMLSR